MLIDWFTVIAQIINFLILLFLLNRFLYRPISATLEKRQRTLEERWQEVDERQREAAEEAQALRSQRQELEDQRSSMVHEAEADAEATRKSLIDEARQAVADQRQAWEQALTQELESQQLIIQKRLVWQVLRVARQVLHTIANQNLETQALQRFLQQLADPQDLQSSLDKLAREQPQQLTVCSSFELSSQQRQDLQRALGERGITPDSFRYTTDEQLICGLKLMAEGYELHWGVQPHLEQIKTELMQGVQQP